MLKGVKRVDVGYAGGHTEEPDYESIHGGTSGHAEVIQVEYDPDGLSFEELLHVFFSSHDATQLNRQGADIGEEYRSLILYTTERQREKAQHYIDVLNKSALQRIVTEVQPLKRFYPAEEEHRDFYAKNPTAGYCQVVIAPKVETISRKFKNLIQPKE